MEWIYEKERIYYADESGKVMAEASLKKEGNTVFIQRIYVDESLRGQGIAGKLMEATMKELQKENRKVVPICSYAKKWLEKNMEKYQDFLE